MAGGISYDGEPLTEEQQYDVVIVSTGAVHGSFVVHFHVRRHRRATVNNQNASQSHLKPGTQREHPLHQPRRC